MPFNPEPSIREEARTIDRSGCDRKYKHRRRSSTGRSKRKWIDLEDNVLEGHIFLDDSYYEPGTLPGLVEGSPYERAVEADDDENDADDDNGRDDEDTDSHGRSEYLMCNPLKCSRRPRSDIDLSTTYPLANSHGNSYLEWSSHNKYADLRTEILARNHLSGSRGYLEDPFLPDCGNSHAGISPENREKLSQGDGDSDQFTWESRSNTNYEVANSHSNYRVYYDSQMQQEDLIQASAWPPTRWGEHLFPDFSADTSAREQGSDLKNEAGLPSSIMTVRPKVKTENDQEENEPGCDIEQCLVQIEESLLNIEQNLLHVQDLDIPELRNLLYKSPSIERSLFEVQDLLYTDNVVPILKRSKSLESEADEEEEEEEEEEEDEEEDVWLKHDLTVRDNDNDKGGNSGAGPADGSNDDSSDTANPEERNPSDPADGIGDTSNLNSGQNTSVLQNQAGDSVFTLDPEKPINFIPNSLNKTIPRKIILEETKENIRVCYSEPGEHTTIDYNLNCVYGEKTLLFRDKCHSRTTSLDENPSFQNLNFLDKHEIVKTSLRNLIEESPANLDIYGKAKSEGTLESPRSRKLRKSRSKKASGENLYNTIEAGIKDCRKIIASSALNQTSTIPMEDSKKRATRCSKESIEEIIPRSREKSPTRSRRTLNCLDKSQEREKDSCGGGRTFEKKKRKKITTRIQSSSDGALVPSKLISLSLSLLLAALLQAVRCLTDLVEDAFRSVSYDRNSLLQ